MLELRLTTLRRFVICNSGFTIERTIHGKEATYNDIASWKFKDLLTVFGASEKQAKTFQASTKDELDSLLNNPGFIAAECLQLVELYMDRDDIPRGLKLTSEATSS